MRATAPVLEMARREQPCSHEQCWDVAAQAGSSTLLSEVALMSKCYRVQRHGKCWWPPGILTWGHRAGKRLLHLHHP